MKKLSGFNKVVYFLNLVLTIVTLLAYLLPYMAPKLFPFLSVFTLLMPLLLIFNLLFFTYWLVQVKRQMLLSGIVLLLGITFINKFYKFSETNLEPASTDFTLMSYNVRKFNVYNWIPREDVAEKISGFVQEKNPDILCLQEYGEKGNEFFKNYKYKYVFNKAKNTSQAIYSKFKIIDSGFIDFPETGNNIIYADIKKGKDTLRVYSMHLQSIKISPEINEEMDENRSKLIFKRLSDAFKQQQQQGELIEQHKSNCPYKMIICGDLNNSAYSYVYRSVRGNMNDAFEEAGTGFGKSYNYRYYPARIDYVFTDDAIVIKQYTTFSTFINSDHFPVLTRLSIDKED